MRTVIGLPIEEAKLKAEEEYKDSIEAHRELEKNLVVAREKAKATQVYQQDLIENLLNSTKTVTFEKIFTHGSLLDGLVTPVEKCDEFEEPEFVLLPEGYSISAGVVIQLPDGRVVLTEPTGAFAGYKFAFPKGRKDEGETLQETAIREAKEESGLEVRLTGVIGDYRGGST